MRRLWTILLILCFSAPGFSHEDKTDDVFIPIAKYVRLGDADRLSAWFDDTVEVGIYGPGRDVSRRQARQLMRSFFASHQPQSFRVSHTAGKLRVKYAIGTLKTGGETSVVTIFVTRKENGYRIQQLKVEKVE